MIDRLTIHSHILSSTDELSNLNCKYYIMYRYNSDGITITSTRSLMMILGDQSIIINYSTAK